MPGEPLVVTASITTTPAARGVRGDGRKANMEHI